MQFYRSFVAPKALTFDLDDTLYDNWPVIVRAEQAMHDWLLAEHPVTASMSRDDWQVLKRKVGEYYPMLRHNVTAWRFEMIKVGLMQLGYDPVQAKQAAENGINEFLHWRCQVEVPALTHQVMSQLAERYPLVAITNGNVDVERIGLGQYFDLVLMAGRDGMSKPAPDLFLQAVEHLGVAADEILHVGDHLVTDVAGAKRHGLSACWFNDKQRKLGSEPRTTHLPDIEIASLDSLLMFCR